MVKITEKFGNINEIWKFPYVIEVETRYSLDTRSSVILHTHMLISILKFLIIF